MSANKTARKIILIQMLVTAVAVVISLAIIDLKAGYSAFVGGGISIISTLYFAHKVFSAGPGSSAQQVAKVFYIAELVKILLTGLLFVIALLWLDLSFLPLFLTYAVTLLAYWLVLPLTLADS